MKLIEALRVAESLEKLDYNRLIVVTADTRSIRIWWVINQVNAEGDRDPIHFREKVLNEWKSEYT